VDVCADERDESARSEVITTVAVVKERILEQTGSECIVKLK